MIDFAISFYNDYKILFYFIVLIWVIFEGPILILTLTILAPKLWINFSVLVLLAIFWDFWWDLLHFLAWKYSKKIFFKNKKLKTFNNFKEKIKDFSLFEKLLVIKYTPPITSIWLIYLGFSWEKFLNFFKNDFPICIFSSFLILFIWYYFWEYFKDNNNLVLIFFTIWVAIFFIIFFTRIFSKFILNKIYKKNDT